MIPRQLKEIHFGAGLNTRGDARAQPEHLLDIGVNVEFDDIGDLRCRFPFDAIRTNIVGGGTLANARRLAMRGDELVCFTDTALYSWIPALSAWEYRGDHLAVATDEETVFATPGDQRFADRAELNGHIVYCWETPAEGIRIAVRDKVSGTVVQPPTTIVPGVNLFFTHPRLVALNNSVLLFWVSLDLFSSFDTLKAASITVAPYTFTAAVAPIATGTGGVSLNQYDVCRVPGQDRCLVAFNDSGGLVGNGSYTVTSVDSAFAGAQTARTVFATPSNNPIAIAISPDAAYVTVVLSTSPTALDGDELYADIWNLTAAGVPLTFVAGETRIDNSAATQGAPLDDDMFHVTAAYRLTKDAGQYRCYVFWARNENTVVPATKVFMSCANWIDATNTAGAAVPFVYGLGVASRAFAHDSHVYLVGAFAGLSFSATDPTGTFSELQNTYYLYRDDAFLVAKAVWGEAGGFQERGWLPTVAPDSGNGNVLELMGTIRRIVSVGKNADQPSHPDNYAERAPREIAFTFDDDRARRSLQFGATLYVLGGIVLQYDGVQLVELGTATYPWQVNLADGGAGGALAAAGYTYRCTDRWPNAQGETDRSTTGTVANFTSAASHKINVSTTNLYVTRKTGVALEVWRTQGDPPAGAPFLLVTSQDPSVTSGSNDYLTSNPASSALVTFVDNLTDAQIGVLPASPENGAALANIEPPSATIAFTDSQRVYLAGIPGYPNAVYYSKYRQPGLVAAFNDALTFDVPAEGGAVTAIGALDGALIVWCETATYQFSGAGNDDTGGGVNFQLSRLLSKDLGCVGPEACEFFGGGWLVKTNKGWHVLDRSLTYQYVGEAAYKYDAEPVLAMSVLTARHQVRILTSGRMLVFDTLVNQWAESSISDGRDALLWNGTPAYLTATGVRAELATWDGYSLTFATASVDRGSGAATLILTARVAGAGGNLLSFAWLPGANAVNDLGNVVTLTYLNPDGGGPTVQDVANLVNASSFLITATVAGNPNTRWNLGTFEGSVQLSSAVGDYTLTAMDIELGWIKFGSMQARAIVDFVQLLGELRSSCVIRKRIAKDYEALSPGVWNYHTDKTWTPSPGVIGSAMQVRQAPKWKRCEAIKARFTITAVDGVSPLGGPCVRVTSLSIPFALEPNAYGAVSAAQKQ